MLSAIVGGLIVTAINATITAAIGVPVLAALDYYAVSRGCFIV